MNRLCWSMLLWGWRGIEIERRLSLDSPHLCCFQNLGAWLYNYICIYHIHMQSMYSTVYLHPKIWFPQTSITSSPQTAYHSHILGIWPFLTNILASNLQFPHLILKWLTIVKLQWTCSRPHLFGEKTPHLNGNGMFSLLGKSYERNLCWPNCIRFENQTFLLYK